MLISDSRKFVFVHLMKTGGESITETLMPFASVVYPDGHYKHATARTIRREFFAPENGREWSDYFSFGVIRNPWEQVHSDYHYCRRCGVPNARYGTWRDKVIRAKSQSFAEFVVDICGPHGTDGPGMFQHYLADEHGEQMVSRVVRMEDLLSEWSGICDALELLFFELPRRNVTASRPDYRAEYDDRSRHLVSVRFADDIQRFGYSFERV
tara:strand:- start:298515 stop:299144 length:630 start_codon:yes stop_codon:yes gene_type:complete